MGANGLPYPNGRETLDKPYKVLIDLYDDGSTQKRIIIE